MLVGSIDVGTRNMALCVYCTETKRVKLLELYDLTQCKKYAFADQNAVFLCNHFIETHLKLLRQCAYVGIEKQMIRKMVIVQYSLEALLHAHTCVLQIVPRCVKIMFNISKGSHARNKRAAISKVEALIPNGLSAFRKKDDVADAVLMALYLARDHEKLVQKKLQYCLQCGGRKRKRIR